VSFIPPPCSSDSGALSCETDSITVCPPASGVFDVQFEGEVDVRPLTCDTDSVTVCQPVVNVNDIFVTPVSVTSVQLLAPNPNRVRAIIYNDSTGTVFIRFGSAASLTNYSLRILTLTSFTIDFGYVGSVEGIWQNVVSGQVRVTEFV